jgi:hypothetical protein
MLAFQTKLTSCDETALDCAAPEGTEVVFAKLAEELPDMPESEDDVAAQPESKAHAAIVSTTVSTPNILSCADAHGGQAPFFDAVERCHAGGVFTTPECRVKSRDADTGPKYEKGTACAHLVLTLQH